MQRTTAQHVSDRFDERITKIDEYKKLYVIDKVNTLKFNEEDYQTLWKICKNDLIGYNIMPMHRQDGKLRSYRKIIFYKELPMWVVFTTVKKKPKTIYPVRSNVLKKLKLILSN